MARRVLVAALAAGWLCGLAVAQTSTLKLSRDLDRSAYHGYVAEKAYDAVLGGWTVRLSQGGSPVGVFSAGPGVFSSWHIEMGLANFLGRGDKQLVIAMWTGGIHCCDVYWVAELGQEFQLVFNGRDHEGDLRREGDGSFPASDLDGDGQLEFWQYTPHFDNSRTSFADSPEVKIYFKYDKDEMRHVPANRVLWPTILRELEPTIRQIEKWNQQVDASKYHSEAEAGFPRGWNYRRDILTVTLAELYAGREAEGWAFFEKQYRLRNKRKWRRAVVKKLESDNHFYRRMKSPSLSTER